MGVLPVLFSLDISRHYWAQSRISDAGRLWLWGVHGFAIILGIVAAQHHPAWLGLCVLGASGFALSPRVIEMCFLQPFEAKADSSDSKQIHRILGELSNNKWILRFAPQGWIDLQKSKLNLALGDGRAAKRTLAELDRMSRFKGKRKELNQGLAYANLLTLDPQDRVLARKLLLKDDKLDDLSPQSLLLWAISVVLDSGRCGEVLRYVPSSPEQIASANHRQLVLGLAYHKNDQPQLALRAFESCCVDPSEENLLKHDPLLRELLHRARKTMRGIHRSSKMRRNSQSKNSQLPREIRSNAKNRKNKVRQNSRKKKDKAESKRMVSSGASLIVLEPPRVPDSDRSSTEFQQEPSNRRLEAASENSSSKRSISLSDWTTPSASTGLVMAPESTQARILELSAKWDEWLVDAAPPETSDSDVASSMLSD